MARNSDKKSKKTDKPKVKLGRPTIYSEELADLICERIATHDIGLTRLCAMYDDMPTKETINQWRWKYDSFSDRYVKAKQLQAEVSAEACLEIADDATNDFMEALGEGGQPEGYKLNGEHVARSRLRIDTRKWLAAKLAPKIYGERQVVEQHNYSHEDKIKELK